MVWGFQSSYWYDIFFSTFGKLVHKSVILSLIDCFIYPYLSLKLPSNVK